MAMKVLVCIDGEPHTRRAIEHAISLGLSLPAEVTALHVVDPWLKQFYNEIHAQGRKNYLEYVDACLQENAERVHKDFSEMCLAKGLKAGFKVRYGEPMTEILEEVRHTAPDLLITGSKPLNAWGRFRSRNLPRRLSKKVGRQTSMISIEASEISIEASEPQKVDWPLAQSTAKQ